MVINAYQTAAEGKNFTSSKYAICMTDALRHWAKATSPLKAETIFRLYSFERYL
jgi:hypothetical protein